MASRARQALKDNAQRHHAHVHDALLQFGQVTLKSAAGTLHLHRQILRTLDVAQTRKGLRHLGTHQGQLTDDTHE